MIENIIKPPKHDRLFAFLRAFPLEAYPSDRIETANLIIVANDGAESPTHIIYRPRSGAPLANSRILALARLEFGGSCNPLVGALPSESIFDLSIEEPLKALSELILGEQHFLRCGSDFIGKRLSEIVVIFAMRRAISHGTVNAGLLAGLAHPALHPCLIAMHDNPAKNWQIDDLTRLSGINRSRFIRVFNDTVGKPPIAYLNEWRLMLARVMLTNGTNIKVVAHCVGFGSASAFSRAFVRKFGVPPSKI